MTSFREKIDLSLIKSINVICNNDDPYATESSSDDESISSSESRRPIKPNPMKRFITKICVPTLIQRYENDSNSYSGTVKRNQETPVRFKGVRQRSWGRFTAEIRDPLDKKKKWIGTFATVEEAVEAYERTRRWFDERLGLIKKPGLAKPENDVVGFTKREGKELEEEGMLEDPLMTLSFPDTFGDSVADVNQ